MQLSISQSDSDASHLPIRAAPSTNAKPNKMLTLQANVSLVRAAVMEHQLIGQHLGIFEGQALLGELVHANLKGFNFRSIHGG